MVARRNLQITVDDDNAKWGGERWRDRGPVKRESNGLDASRSRKVNLMTVNNYGIICPSTLGVK